MTTHPIALLRAILCAGALAAAACLAPTNAARASEPPAGTPPATTPDTPPAKPTPAPATPPAVAPPATPPPPPARAADTELFVRFDTVRGSIRIRLMVREAPMICASFVNLVQRGAYDGASFDDWTRVLRQSAGPVHNFDPGYRVRCEFNAKLRFDDAGKVALQKSSDGVSAIPTRFFITTKEQSRWDLDLPIFGIVAAGQTAVDEIAKDDRIERAVVEGDPAPLLARFSKELPTWNAALDAAMAKAQLPPLRAAAATTAPVAPAAPEKPAAPVPPAAAPPAR
ncbi:MAG: peptidylprolyl isomerase [Phycisphaerales bacterium]